MKDKAAAIDFMRGSLRTEQERLKHQLKMVEVFPESKWATDMHREAGYTAIRCEYYADAIEALEKL